MKQKTKKRMTKLERKQIEELKNSPEAVRKREKRAKKARAKEEARKQAEKAKEEALKQAKSASSQEDDEEEEEFPLLTLTEQEEGLTLEKLVQQGLRFPRKEYFEQSLREENEENDEKGGGKPEVPPQDFKKIQRCLSLRNFRRLYKKHPESCIHLVCETIKFPNKAVKEIGFRLLEKMLNEGRFEVAIFTYIWSRDHVPSAIMRMMSDPKYIGTFKDFGCDYWIQSSLKKQKENEEIRKLRILKIEDEAKRLRQLEKLEERKELLEKLGAIYKI